MKISQIANASMYTIYEDGRIFSKYVNRFITPILDRKVGYYRIALKLDSGGKSHFLVHRLLAIHFIPNPENKEEVNHIDGNKLNNSINNLEWVTRNENMAHAHKLKLRDNSGEGNPINILSEQDVLDIYNSLIDGARVSDLALKYNVSQPTIADIKAKRNWQYLLEDLPSIQHKAKRQSLSESTVRWICEQLQSGVRICDILRISTNKNITEKSIYDIKRRLTFKYISCEYSFK